MIDLAEQGGFLGRALRTGAARCNSYLGNDKFRTASAALLLVLNCVLLVTFLFTSYKGYFHSDSAVRNLLAQEMYESGQFFPTGWNYVNKDLMVLFAQVGVWPLLYFFKNTYVLFAVVGVLSCALILASAWWFTSLLGGETWRRLLALAVLAGGVSINMAEGIFGQAAYGYMLMITCLTAVLSWKGITEKGARSYCWCGLLLVLAILYTWSNPQRALATYVLPLLCGLVAFVWGREWDQRAEATAPALVATLLGVLVGAMLSKWTLAHVENNITVGSALWLGYDEMVRNSVQTVHGLLVLLGAVPVKGANVASATGVYQALRVFAAFAVMVLIAKRLVAHCSGLDARARFVGGLVSGALVCFLFLHVTTTIPDMSNPVAVSRYLVPALALGLMVLIGSGNSVSGGFGGLIAMSAILLIGSNSLVRSNAEGLLSKSWHSAERIELSRALVDSGGKYGYATYWDAGVSTVLTGSQVKLRQIQIVGGEIQPMRHLSSNNWYEPEAWQGETLLLLSDAEVAAVNWAWLTSHAGLPIRETKIGNRRLFVFGENLSKSLPGWSMKLREPLQLNAGPDSPKTAGKWLHRQGEVLAEKGEAGYLQYGPYRSLGPGRYVAHFDVTATSPSPHQVVGSVDVVALNGTRLYGTQDVIGDGKKGYVLKFELPNSVRDLELRVMSNGNGQVAYKGVTLLPSK